MNTRYINKYKGVEVRTRQLKSNTKAIVNYARIYFIGMSLRLGLLVNSIDTRKCQHCCAPVELVTELRVISNSSCKLGWRWVWYSNMHVSNVSTKIHRTNPVQIEHVHNLNFVLNSGRERRALLRTSKQRRHSFQRQSFTVTSLRGEEFPTSRLKAAWDFFAWSNFETRKRVESRIPKTLHRQLDLLCICIQTDRMKKWERIKQMRIKLRNMRRQM